MANFDREMRMGHALILLGEDRKILILATDTSKVKAPHSSYSKVVTVGYIRFVHEVHRDVQLCSVSSDIAFGQTLNYSRHI